MEKVVLIVHGSPIESANQFNELVSNLIEVLKISRDDLAISFLKYGKPTPYEAVDFFVKDGAKRIIIHPFFLTQGGHISKDIPEIVEQLKKAYRDVEFICTKPLGMSNRLALVIKDLIEQAKAQPR